MADKGGLQLLPETRKKIEVKVPGENRLISIGAALIAIVLVVSGGLWWYSGTLIAKISDADVQIANLEKQRDKKAEQNLITLAKQVSITDQILKTHIYWSEGFSKIESILENNVQFKSFSGTAPDAGFTIHGVTDSYATLAKQLASFASESTIKDVLLDGVTAATTGKLDFNARINFDASKFLKNK